ncbi:MerR family transcriptional regulator [uncultured Desulfosarcina sp.]|uniref:MerR family transcriptional regulator n=1 Tax=uncultured Desulfosarcina sp. TaxID=218289 RepID=UPI0029C76BA0|nr:MerR family transcriptional regulator [uncultured Desulfosarcina sp.]
MKKERFSISNLAAELGITSRSIRFYEEKGLLHPGRTQGNQRVYTSKDRARLKLILRGKRFGYTLDEIAKMIGLADVDVNEIDQIRSALSYGDKKLKEIAQRLKELKTLETDMRDVREKLIRRLETLERKKSDV